METTPKLAILETLREMDNLQAESVLRFIKSLLANSKCSNDYGQFKQQALREIRSALNNNEELTATS
jgi:hypothetical protein